MTINMRDELRRARIHLALLEQDGVQPLEFLNKVSPTSPPLILRAEEKLYTAHSEVGIGYEQLRELMILNLQERVDKLTGILTDGDPHFSVDQLQYGDQTEA